MISYTLNGKGSETIILLHGNSSSKGSFVRLEESLSKSHQVLCIDLPGHGESAPFDQNKEYSVENIVSELANVINGLNLGEVKLVGHSLGAHLAIALTEKLDVKLAALILINGVPANNLTELSKIFNPVPEASFIFKNELSTEELTNLLNLIGKKQAEFLKKDFLATDSRFRESLFNSLLKDPEFNELKILNSLEVPVKLILSEEDKLLNIDYIKDLQEELDGIDFHFLKGATHFPQCTHTTELVSLI